MSVLFMNVQQVAEYSSIKDAGATNRRDDGDKFERHLDRKSEARHESRSSVDRTDNASRIDRSEDASESSESDSSVLYIQNAQGEAVKIPLSAEQLEHIANVERVSLVDPEILEQFGGLANFMEAVKSLIPGNPDISEVDIVYLPYQIEALGQEQLGSETFPHLIAVNLSPAELSALADRLGTGQIDGSTAAFINKVSAGELINVLFVSDSSQNSGAFSQEDIQSYLDDLSVNADETGLLQMFSEMSLSGREAMGIGKWFENQSVGDNLVTMRGLMSSDMSQDMQMGEGLGKGNAFGQMISQIASGKGNIQESMASFLASSKGADVQGGLAFGGGFNDALSADLLPMDADAQMFAISSTPVTSSSLQTAHAHGVLGGHQAGQTHQATQVMAMAIQKSAGDGGSQKLSVLLNPPELGRVQLDVEMGVDNKLKVSMIAEKEAGFMQLQKDSGMLEQILQNAGLDVNEGDIDLSFASDGFLFDHQNQEELAELYMNTPDSEGVEGAEEEVLETHVDLYQDPYSGAWHYNILV